MTTGIFITFEGGEGAGKSTQIRRLAQRLNVAGHEVVLTREPGGSEGAEAIRDLVLNGPAEKWSAVTETLLMYAARRDHLERVIRPALERGCIVLCDRFADSTRAYQGAGGDVDPDLIEAMERHVVEGAWPDLTLILDLPVTEGLARAASRGGGEARFESKGQAFHERLRAAFLAIAEREPGRCVVVAADQSIDAVEGAIWAAVEPRLKAR
ncbi:dTMP kinase [Caulobacter sp. NIBR2454]|uniref:dTMP kinase n=1 Tax=Caulobacter sp. NIBR2454 TaxID=3015996 RepID=UPI0022B69D98|nr:dTMP kinase [Caulobacter sp. NIBR2454]